MSEAAVWAGYALLNVALMALVASLRPRRAANTAVAVLFGSNAGVAVALAGGLALGPSTPWRQLAEAFNLPSVMALIAIPWFIPRRRLSHRGERALLGLLAVVAAAGLFELVGDPSPDNILLDPRWWGAFVQALPYYVGLAVGSVLLLDAYVGNRSEPLRAHTAFFLTAYALKDANVVFYQFPTAFTSASVGLGLWLPVLVALQLVFWTVVLAIPLAVAAARLRRRRADPWRPHLGWDGLVVGALGVGYALSLVGAPPELEVMLLRPVLFAYGILLFQLLDVDLRRRWWLVATAVIASMGIVFVTLVGSLEAVGVGPGPASGLGLMATLGLGAAAGGPFVRRLVGVEPSAGARDQALYAAAVEAAMLDNTDHATSNDRLLRALRGHMGISEREHSLLEAGALARRGLPGAGGAPASFLGRYRVEGVLGEGGFGVTYLAEDEQVGRRVVLKVARTPSPEVARRLAREARVLAELNHPNVVALYDVEQVAGDVILVLEYVEGGSLADLLQRGPLPPGRALAVADDVLAALEAAHARGIVHRDLKPANVLLAPDGRAKLADFGVAADPRGSGTVSGGSGGGQPGTVRYMSPEQARDLPVDARSDLYSFSALMVEVLAGEPYLDFEGKAEFDVRLAILEDEPRLPLRGLPPGLNALLAEALNKDPAQRPASAAAMRRRLAEARQALAGAEAGADGDAAAPPRPRARAATPGGSRKRGFGDA